jgi:hypothetical protein
MFSIIASTAETLHIHHILNVQSAAQAAARVKSFETVLDSIQ